MHYCIFVTNTDKINLAEQMAPFDENDESFFEKNIICKAGEYREYAKEIRAEWEITPDTNPKLHELYKTQQAKCDACKTDEDCKDLIKHSWGLSEDDEGNLFDGYNPNAKWDWYVEGGRWEKYYVNSKDEYIIKFKKYELDTGRTLIKEKQEARETYRYWKEKSPSDWWKILGCTIGTTENEYADKIHDIEPYGILHDGEWVDRDGYAYGEKYAEIWNSLPDDAEITIVDVHI